MPHETGTELTVEGVPAAARSALRGAAPRRRQCNARWSSQRLCASARAPRMLLPEASNAGRARRQGVQRRPPTWRGRASTSASSCATRSEPLSTCLRPYIPPPCRSLAPQPRGGRRHGTQQAQCSLARSHPLRVAAHLARDTAPPGACAAELCVAPHGKRTRRTHRTWLPRRPRAVR